MRRARRDHNHAALVAALRARELIAKGWTRTNIIRRIAQELRWFREGRITDSGDIEGTCKCSYCTRDRTTPQPTTPAKTRDERIDAALQRIRQQDQQPTAPHDGAFTRAPEESTPGSRSSA